MASRLFVALGLVACLLNPSRAVSDPESHIENLDDSHGSNSIVIIPLGILDPEHDIPGEPLSPRDFKNALVVTLDPPPRDSVAGDPLELAGLFEGDISGVSEHDIVRSGPAKGKNAIKNMNLRWPSGIIPYVISASFSLNERSVIARAVLEYHNKTCIRFVPRTNERDFIYITQGSGCSSNVGRTGGQQPVTLGTGCVYVGIVIHELMHAAGFWHEQSRADRDQYIDINFNNIVDGMSYNFQKYTLDKIQYLGAPYDTGSVMHYDAYAFAKDRRMPTIIPKNKDTELGQRRGFSPIDIQKINRLYNCNAGGSGSTTTATTTAIPMVSTEAPGKCQDNNQYCKPWADKGECTKNAAWMTVNCRKSCQQCNVECGNSNIYCDQWAKQGECSANAEYMNIYCAKSCGVCNAPGASSTNACADENRYCAAWAQSGQCKSNPDYMLLKCKKSCKKC